MLRGRSALARVCLCLVCLLGLPATEPRAIDSLIQVQSLIDIAPQNDSGCRLYTPTAADYGRCLRSSLTCFSEEIQVLIAEWRIAGVFTKNQPFGLKRGLGQLAKGLNKSDSTCHSCELYPEKEAVKFLGELKGILEKMNSRSLSP